MTRICCMELRGLSVQGIAPSMLCAVNTNAALSAVWGTRDRNGSQDGEVCVWQRCLAGYFEESKWRLERCFVNCAGWCWLPTPAEEVGE